MNTDRSRWWSSTLPLLVLVALISASVVAAVGRGSRKLLWHDEVLTVAILRQPVEQLAPMLLSGIDLTPPLFHVLTEAGWYLPLPEALGVRFASIVAFAVCLLALYAFASYRATRWHGLVAACAFAASGAYVFAFEARAYALLLAFNALAFVCWQRATDQRTDGRQRFLPLALLAITLAAAVSSHYYGLLVPLPFAVAELARIGRRRRLDWGLSIAVLVGMSPLLAFRDFIAAGTNQAADFFSPPNWRVMVESYELYGLPLVLPTLMAIVVCAATMMTAFSAKTPSSWTNDRQPFADIPVHELIATMTLMLLPAIALALALGTGTGYVARYTVTWTIGLALTLGLLARHLRRPLLVAAVLSCALWLAARDAQGARHLMLPPVDTRQTFAALARTASGDIAIPHPHVFVQLHYYVSPEIRERLVFVESHGLARRGETGAIAIRAISRWEPMRTTDLDRLLVQEFFYVYSPHTWLVDALVARGADVRLIANDEAETPFAVSRPGVLSLYEVRPRSK